MQLGCWGGGGMIALTTDDGTDLSRRKRWQERAQRILGLIDKDSACDGETGCDSRELCYHHKS